MKRDGRGWDAKAISKIANEVYGSMEKMFECHDWPERGKKMMPNVGRRVKERYGSVCRFVQSHENSNPGGGEIANEQSGELEMDEDSTSGKHREMFDRRMLEALICPRTHAVLRYDSEHNELISEAAGVAFPIRNGIPIMLMDEARELE